jgi:hypothetical protein
MTPVARPPFTRESVLAKIEALEDVRNAREPEYGPKNSLRCVGFVSRAARALSQYYLWLQRTDKPW